MAAKFTLSDPIGSKYRIKIEGSGFLRQMGPRKLSKSRAELRIAALNAQEEDPTIHVESVSVEPTEASIGTKEGSNTVQLTATVLPEDATNKNVTWTLTSDSEVITVDKNGLVTATGDGTATVTATTEDGGKTATCAITAVTTK